MPYFTSVRYLPLETTDECLIAQNARYQVIENYVLVTSPNQCFLFDSATGKFIREIGHKGNGPGGFSLGLGFYNPYNKAVYFSGWGGYELIKYSLEGEFLGKISVPAMSNTRFSYASAYAALDNNCLCAFFSNLDGKETKRVMIFSESGEVIKVYPNHRIINTS